MKQFAEEVVEKHNVLVVEYKAKQGELSDARETELHLRKQLQELEDENIKLKDLSDKLEKRLIDFQNHINNLLDRFQNLEEEKKKQEATISSLERYIEIMDKTPKRIKNERGAGRKKKYTQEQIDWIVNARLNGVEYSKIVEDAAVKFPQKEWTIKEIKYIFSRYKK